MQWKTEPTGKIRRGCLIILVIKERLTKDFLEINEDHPHENQEGLFIHNSLWQGCQPPLLAWQRLRGCRLVGKLQSRKQEMLRRLCRGTAGGGPAGHRSSYVVGLGSISGFLSLFLSWKRGQKIRKALVTDQHLTVLGQLWFGSPGWLLLEFVGQSSVVTYGLAMVHLRIQSFNVVYLRYVTAWEPHFILSLNFISSTRYMVDA